MTNSTDAAPELSEQTRRHLLAELETLGDQRSDLGSLGNDDGVADSGDAAEQLRRIDDATRLDDRIKEIKRLLAAGTSMNGPAIQPEQVQGLAHDGVEDAVLDEAGDVTVDNRWDHADLLDHLDRGLRRFVR